ncbi:hypothetical protein SAY86_003900 [Trapa natans]|uniref:Uncharacterized protein n=1 Tax=Trapa natans TaxID=22666 RepID=A0AAN7N572_TRANT|nr:hypothetical protein SAY86_003900 [Trapa natans]
MSVGGGFACEKTLIPNVSCSSSTVSLSGFLHSSSLLLLPLPCRCCYSTEVTQFVHAHGYVECVFLLGSLPFSWFINFPSMGTYMSLVWEENDWESGEGKCFFSIEMDEDANTTKNEEEEFNTGPLSVLMMSVKNNTQVYFDFLHCPFKSSGLSVLIVIMWSLLLLTVYWLCNLARILSSVCCLEK